MKQFNQKITNMFKIIPAFLALSLLSLTAQAEDKNISQTLNTSYKNSSIITDKPTLTNDPSKKPNITPKIEPMQMERQPSAIVSENDIRIKGTRIEDNSYFSPHTGEPRLYIQAVIEILSEKRISAINPLKLQLIRMSATNPSQVETVISEVRCSQFVDWIASQDYHLLECNLDAKNIKEAEELNRSILVAEVPNANGGDIVVRFMKLQATLINSNINGGFNSRFEMDEGDCYATPELALNYQETLDWFNDEVSESDTECERFSPRFVLELGE